MEIQVQLILTMFIVHFGSTSIQPHNQMVDQTSISSKVEEKSAIRENFQNLLNSIAKNNKRKSEIYHEILMQDAAREQQVFDGMKEDLWTAQNRNFHKKINFYKENNIGEHGVASKREVAKEKRRRYWKKTYEQDEEVLEKWFREVHPNVDDIKWPQVKKLQQKTHRKLCDRVYQNLQPFYDQYKFVEEVPPDPEGLSKRVRGPELLELKKEMVPITVVECIYDRNATLITAITPPQAFLYLTNANSSRVFTLRKDEDVDIFYLQTGLHTVSYSSKNYTDIPWVPTGDWPK